MKIPSRIHSLQSVLKSIVLAGLAVALSTAAHAGLVVYEGFNYAGQADNAALNSGSFNGGTGLSGNWQGSGNIAAPV